MLSMKKTQQPNIKYSKMRKKKFATETGRATLSHF